MDNEICVSCHAPSLSLLLFETVRSSHDQRGLLIGEVRKEVILEKTDENEMNREQRTTIYLEHCIPIKDNDLFGCIGNVNKQKFQKYIDQYCGKVVGWYSFRRNTRVNSRTLQEMLIHKSLTESINHIRPEHFVVAFMSASIGGNFSTHTYNHIFMRFHPVRGGFEPLKLKIFTMSDKIINVNDYSIRNAFPTSKNFENIINPSQEEASPVISVLKINKAISEYFKIISKQLQDAEKSRSDLEQEIKLLRKRLQLDKLQEIKVDELKRERQVVGVQYVRYNANINYNPEGKENPIKVIPIFATPKVPEVSEESENGNSNCGETIRASLSKGLPGMPGTKSRGKGRGYQKSGSHSNHFEPKCQGEILELSKPSDEVRSGNNPGNAGDSDSTICDGNEQSFLQLEENKMPLEAFHKQVDSKK